METTFKIGEHLRCLTAGIPGIAKGEVVKLTATHYEPDEPFDFWLSFEETGPDSKLNPTCFERVDPPFQSMQFKINSPVHSTLVQKHLFSLGYQWISWSNGRSDQAVKMTDIPYLTTNDDGFIFSSTEGRSESSIPHYELVTTYDIRRVPEVETVKLNGKTYRKEDLEAALEKLEPIDE
jgi:hypothetical protein